MTPFFSGTRPSRVVTHGDATFELPILYQRDDFFGLYFTADRKRVEAILPSNNLYPVPLPNGRVVVGVAAYNYINTSIGTYGEVPVAIPVVWGKRPTAFTGMAPALLESSYPGFGVLVHHLPVTKASARDAGRGEWGYTKFVADMRFTVTPEYYECRMHEGESHILSMRVMKKGFPIRDNRPITTFSVLENKLIRTVIPAKGVKKVALRTKGAFLDLGDHPMARSMEALDLSPRPFMSFYYPERAAILPSGEVVEEEVQPFDGYAGETRDGVHEVSYLA